MDDGQAIDYTESDEIENEEREPDWVSFGSAPLENHDMEDDYIENHSATQQDKHPSDSIVMWQDQDSSQCSIPVKRQFYSIDPRH